MADRDKNRRDNDARQSSEIDPGSGRTSANSGPAARGSSGRLAATTSRIARPDATRPFPGASRSRQLPGTEREIRK